jgi:hypothetical protein
MVAIAELEKRFNRAMKLSFVKKKIIITFFTLILCSIFILFSMSIPLKDKWMQVCLIFLSIFLASSILLALGVFLIRIYYHEVKSKKLSITKIFSKSFEIIIGSTYLTFPLIITFLLLWIMLGVFNFLVKIPKLGLIIDTILAFAPFILIFCLVFLCFINICILFFITPSIGLKLQKKLIMIKILIKNINSNLFIHFFSFILGILPLAITAIMLIITFNLTTDYANQDKIINSVRAFFMSLPISFIMTPFTIFFFNFSAEIHQLLLKNE